MTTAENRIKELGVLMKMFDVDAFVMTQADDVYPFIVHATHGSWHCNDMDSVEEQVHDLIAYQNRHRFG